VSTAACVDNINRKNIHGNEQYVVRFTVNKSYIADFTSGRLITTYSFSDNKGIRFSFCVFTFDHLREYNLQDFMNFELSNARRGNAPLIAVYEQSINVPCAFQQGEIDITFSILVFTRPSGVSNKNALHTYTRNKCTKARRPHAQVSLLNLGDRRRSIYKFEHGKYRPSRHTIIGLRSI
jgi:hypothetical protein